MTTNGTYNICPLREEKGEMENKEIESRKKKPRCRPLALVLYITFGILLVVVVALFIYIAHMKKEMHMVLMQAQENTKEKICLDSSFYLNETLSEQFKPEYNRTIGTMQVNCWTREAMTVLQNTTNAFLQKPKTKWKMPSQNNVWPTNPKAAR